MSALSRRSLVAGAAALPALAVPAITVAAIAEPDPIFAAIERWEEAAAIEDAAYYGDGIDHDDPATVKAQGNASGRRVFATGSVFETVPTTLGGIRAKIDFALSRDFVTDLLLRSAKDDPDELVRNFIETLYEGARVIAVQS
jgi:hypothetical protein